MATESTSQIQNEDQSIKKEELDPSIKAVKKAIDFYGGDSSRVDDVETSPSSLGMDVRGAVTLRKLDSLTMYNPETGNYEELRGREAQKKIGEEVRGVIEKKVNPLRTLDTLLENPREKNAELFQHLSDTFYWNYGGTLFFPVVFHREGDVVYEQDVGRYTIGELCSKLSSKGEDLVELLFNDGPRKEGTNEVDRETVDELIAYHLGKRVSNGRVELNEDYKSLKKARRNEVKKILLDDNRRKKRSSNGSLEEEISEGKIKKKENELFSRERRDYLRETYRRIFSLQDKLEEVWNSDDYFKQTVPKPHKPEKVLSKDLKTALSRLNPNAPENVSEKVEKIFSDLYFPTLAKGGVKLSIGDCNADNFIKRGEYPYEKPLEGSLVLPEIDVGFKPPSYDIADFLTYAHEFCGASHSLLNEMWKEAFQRYGIEDDETRPLMESFMQLKKIGASNQLMAYSSAGTPKHISYRYYRNTKIDSLNEFFDRVMNPNRMESLITYDGEERGEKAKQFFRENRDKFGELRNLLNKNYLSNTNYDSKE